MCSWGDLPSRVIIISLLLQKSPFTLHSYFEWLLVLIPLNFFIYMTLVNSKKAPCRVFVVTKVWFAATAHRVFKYKEIMIHDMFTVRAWCPGLNCADSNPSPILLRVNFMFSDVYIDRQLLWKAGAPVSQVSRFFYIRFNPAHLHSSWKRQTRPFSTWRSCVNTYRHTIISPTSWTSTAGRSPNFLLRFVFSVTYSAICSLSHPTPPPKLLLFWCIPGAH